MPILSKEFIVVVEDDKSLREEVVLSLTLAGLTAVGAGDGRGMNELMAKHKVDIVVLDLSLPTETGLEIAARLVRQSPPVGIIMFTGAGSMAEKLIGMQVGADAYLVKPVDMRELIATVQSLRRQLERHRDSVAQENLTTIAGVKKLIRNSALKTADKSSHATQSLAVSFSGFRMSCPARGTEIALSDLQRRFISAFKDVPVGQNVSREHLMAAIGYESNDGDFHRLETLISRFRLKVRSELQDELPLQAIPGQGYALNKAISFEKNIH
jgi:two-component system, OmpR family, response regulator